MARPLRMEFEGALYHLTARGSARQNIFVDDSGRRRFLSLLEKEVLQQGWRCYAYCLISNRYHLLIEIPEANLSKDMRRFNGSHNRRHGRVGHLVGNKAPTKIFPTICSVRPKTDPCYSTPLIAAPQGQGQVTLYL